VAGSNRLLRRILAETSPIGTYEPPPFEGPEFEEAEPLSY